jgi:anti-sigma factor ChrR (cupin superfamily)
MHRFAKQPDCPASATLAKYAAGTLSFLALPSVAEHLAACEFCGAELSLLSRHAPAAVVETTQSFKAAPPIPLALRVLAESMLADVNATVCAGERRAA